MSPTAKSAASTARRAPAMRKATSQKAAVEQLRSADPIMAGLIDACGVIPSPPRKRADPEEHYGALLHAVVNQQLSVKAGAAIYGRLTERFGGRTPTPEQLLADDPEELRLAAGLSRSKVGFMRSLAEHILSGELELERLDDLSDDDVMAELVAVKGIGEWTAHMFLMSHLHRPDVLAPGDLGIRRAIERAYSLEEIPDRETVERLAERWRPHRTLACRYLWRSLNNEPA
ncbi:MAG TPA: DNA-3-methyladenine glycosylase [Solirubrobacteraceae bacterium]|jgi:DNA-3-methyladenine glycosylase II|nr:DNA-3-methyladenine glycosylase [Solirubrobacteraceae bacterium]